MIKKKKSLLDDSSLFFIIIIFSLQPASVHPQPLFPGEKKRPDRERLYPSLSVMSEAAVRHSLSASSYRFTFLLFRASSSTTIDLWINPKQSVINSEPPDGGVILPLCPISHLMPVDVNHFLRVPVTPTDGPLFFFFLVRAQNPNQNLSNWFCFPFVCH